MRVLLLGGSGQLGLSLKELHWNSSIELFSPGREELDVTNSIAIAEAFEAIHPDFVINASAWTNVPGAETNMADAVKLNAHAVGTLAQACKSAGATLVHVSTDFVFDGQKGAPYVEADACNPLNSYGKSKLEGELAIRESGLSSYFIIRTSWLYSKHGKNFVKTIAKKALQHEEATITNDQFGSPTFAGDLAKAIQALVMNPPEPGTYNFSNSGIASWFEFGQEIYKVVGSSVNLVSTKETSDSELPRPKYSPLDLTKWKGTNLMTPVSWQESLKREIDSIVEVLKVEEK